MTKHIQQTYKVLDEIEHIRARTGMYAGSTSIQTSQEWVFNNTTKQMEKRDIAYIPAFIKIFSEILDNSIDEGKRAPDVLNQIKVDITFDEISIQDNGRGIPVEIHDQTGTYVAETVFSNLRAGSNFNDDEDQSLIGTNGVGSTLTNVLSTNFRIESCDGKKKLTQDFWNGMRERSEPKIKEFSKNGTRVTFTPDYEFFKLTGLNADHIAKIQKKVIDAAANNLNIKFYFNGELIKFKSFDDYIALYSDEYYTDNTDEWKVGISSSDGFEQISFINSVETYQGGTHVNYVVDQITTKLREHFKKKHKVDVKPSDIKNHFRVYIAGTVNRPRFSSQTKENMISLPTEWKTSWSVSDKFIKNILKSEIIQSILDWVQAKERATEAAELRKANKNLDKADPRRVEKFHDASTKQRNEAMLFLAEGDCLEEHSELIVQTDSGFISKRIKDISTGDLVISHTGKVNKVENVQHRLKSTLTISTSIGDIECTKEHKIYVYDTTLKEFKFIEAGNLDKSIHKLVKGKFMDYDFVSNIDDIIQIENDPLYQIEFIVHDGFNIRSIKSSLSHRFGCFDIINNKFVFIEACDIIQNQHVFLYKM